MRVCLLILSVFGLSFQALWGQSATEVLYLSDADDSVQPARFYAPDSDEVIPMIVALHSWSNDYSQTLHADIEAWCIEQGWAFLHPNFRGRNKTPEATGSELVVQDIVSAVDYAKRVARIDESAIYLVGTSGGGFASLLMASRHPKIWAGVSAWVPIFDLEAWYHETKKADLRYAGEIEASCGGVPGESTQVDIEYKKRSPKAYMKKAKGVNLHINAGLRDGHDGSVPISHSLNAFNAVALRKDRISAEEIRFFVENAEVPVNLKTPLSDPSYGDKPPLFRRTSGKATVTIFDGDHELVSSAAIDWIRKLHSRK
ncbi:MAG: dienelactone hydrolase [Candidatus Pelagisphaera sp.]|jgi:dienelactone hydrolase